MPLGASIKVLVFKYGTPKSFEGEDYNLFLRSGRVTGPSKFTRPLGDDPGEKGVAWRKVAAAVGFWYNLKMEQWSWLWCGGGQGESSVTVTLYSVSALPSSQQWQCGIALL